MQLGVLMATAFTIIKNAIKNNLEVLGAGRYSAVFGLSKYQAIKIGSDINDPFLDYIEIAKRNPLTNFLKVYNTYKSDNYYIATIERLEHNNKIDFTLLEESISILTKYKNKDSDLDLHTNNVMCRENGTLVLSDPLCGTNMYDILDVSDWLDYHYKHKEYNC